MNAAMQTFGNDLREITINQIARFNKRVDEIFKAPILTDEEYRADAIKRLEQSDIKMEMGTL